MGKAKNEGRWEGMVDGRELLKTESEINRRGEKRDGFGSGGNEGFYST